MLPGTPGWATRGIVRELPRASLDGIEDRSPSAMSRLVQLDHGQLLGARVADPAPDLGRVERPVALPRLVDVQLGTGAFTGAGLRELAHKLRLVVQMRLRFRRQLFPHLCFESRVVGPRLVRDSGFRGRPVVQVLGRGLRRCAPERLRPRRRLIDAPVVVQAKQPGEDPQWDLRGLDADPDAEPGYSEAEA
jgi:hypothetical protein